jgi:hypothetical protein
MPTTTSAYGSLSDALLSFRCELLIQTWLCGCVCVCVCVWLRAPVQNKRIISSIADALLGSLRLQKCAKKQVETAVATSFRTIRTRVNKFQKTNPAEWNKQGLHRTFSGRRNAVSPQLQSAAADQETCSLRGRVYVCARVRDCIRRSKGAYCS